MTAHFPASSIQKPVSFVRAYSTAVQLFTFVKGLKQGGKLDFAAYEFMIFPWYLYCYLPMELLTPLYIMIRGNF